MAARLVTKLLDDQSGADLLNPRAGVIVADGPSGDTLLTTFAGAEITFEGVTNRTTCERCEERDTVIGSSTIQGENWPGRVGAGTLNQTYHVTRNDQPASDPEETHCFATGTVNGPTYFLSHCDNCDCVIVTEAEQQIGPPLREHAINDGLVQVEVEFYQGLGPIPGTPQVVIRAYCDLITFYDAISGSPITTQRTHRVYFFWGVASLCGLSYPTFVVSNQIGTGDVCFTPEEQYQMSTGEASIAGAGGGTATVTLRCVGRGVSMGNPEEFEIDSCGAECSSDSGSSDGSSDESGSDSDSGSSGSGSGSGDPDPSGSSGSGSIGPGSEGDPSGSSGGGDEEPSFVCFALWETVYACEASAWCFEDGAIYMGTACLDETMMPTTEGWYVEPIDFCCCDAETAPPDCVEKTPNATYYRKLSDTPCTGASDCSALDPGLDPECPTVPVPDCQ